MTGNPSAGASAISRLETLVERIVTGTDSPYHVPALLVSGRSIAGPSVEVSRGLDSRGGAITASTLFPTSCVTKIALTYAVLSLVRDRVLDLDHPLDRWLPRLPEASRSLTLRSLLSHTAGMGPEVDIGYETGLDWGRVRAACLSSVPGSPRGTVRYSNIGFGIVGILLERVSDLSPDEMIEQLVCKPLGIRAEYLAETTETAAWIADVRSPLAGTDLEPFNSPFWRGLRLPWAGLWMNAQGLSRLIAPFLKAWRNDAEHVFLRPAVENQAGFEAGGFTPEWRRLGFDGGGPLWWHECPWGLGFEIRGSKWPHWTPKSASPSGFGLLGSSGCLVWAEPERGITWVVLGSRTTDGGWMLRYGPRLGEAILACFD